MSHLIQQHRFHIECQQLELGKIIQQELASILETDFYPKLQLLFDKYDHEDVVIAIEKLTIPLPTLSRKNWQFHLVQESLLAIEEQLRRIVNVEPKGKEFRNAHFAIRHRPTKAKELFVFFLQKGYLASNSISNHLSTILAQLTIDEAFLNDLLELFRREPIAFVRFLLLQDEACKQRVFRLLRHDSPSLPFGHLPLTRDTEVLNEANLLMVAMQGRDPLQPNFLQSVFQLLYPFNQVVYDFIHKQEAYWELKNLSLTLQNAFHGSDFNFSAELLAFVENTRKEEHLHDRNLEDIQSSAEESLYYFINNAGLVIFHPFLPELFQNCGFTNRNNEWVSRKAQHEAATLLQYLFHGRELIFESELILNKVLCGFSIEEVVNTNNEIADTQKQHCLDLLHTVIDYWEVLKNTSVEALRETFLSRDGKLSIEEEYHMIVEQKGVDVLLDRLPWGIGTIKTPWMKTILHCQWNS